MLIESGGEIFRRVELVHVSIEYADDSGRWELVEEKQVFNDGRERVRGLTGVSEKMFPGETPADAARRALREEIGVESDVELNYLGERQTRIDSPSYPGLKSEYLHHEYGVELPAADYSPEGYQETEGGKTTFFVWRPAETHGSEATDII